MYIPVLHLFLGPTPFCLLHHLPSKCLPSSVPHPTRLFRGFDEDYVNDEENALSASFSKSRNLEDMTQYPSNFSVIKIDYKCLGCFLFPRKLFDTSYKFLIRHLCLQSLSHCSAGSALVTVWTEGRILSISAIFTMNKE